jgi:hypothetical protein
MCTNDGEGIDVHAIGACGCGRGCWRVMRQVQTRGKRALMSTDDEVGIDERVGRCVRMMTRELMKGW